MKTRSLPAVTKTAIKLFITSCLIAISTPASAQDVQCTLQDNAAPVYTSPGNLPIENLLNTYISADFSSTLEDGSTLLEGNVVINRNRIRILSDKAQYHQKQDSLDVSGNVHIDTLGLALDANKARFSLSENRKQATFTSTTFLIPPGKPDTQKKQPLALKGTANTITSNDDKTSLLKQAKITSCQLASPDWQISAQTIELDHKDEYGRAHDVVIRFKNVPFLYTPYIEFPISNKRRSGLLFPEFGTSSSRGFEFAQPWYWNIAPDMDATITPRLMSRRGTELGGEYRYLTQSTNGTLQGAWLNNDKLTREQRYQVRYQQHSAIISSLRLDIDLQDISDKDYFNDFSNSLGTTSQTHLDRSASLRYDTDDWHMRALVQKLKTIDTDSALSSRPYARLPQLTLDGESDIALGGLRFTFNAELVDFDHEDDSKATGTRIYLRPGIHWPLAGAAWFFDPSIKFSHTRYDIGPDNGTDLTIENRNLPVSSIDAGLFFERSLENGYTQTLEPRLYYLNVPFKEQSNIPLFDTSIPDFSVSQLFRDNRFNGTDRIGDANQLTAALTSRLLDPHTGDETVRASIGQIFYFQDRRVSINGITETARQSDIIAELDTRLGAWTGNIDIQWDTGRDTLSKQNYFLHYQPDTGSIFNLGYRQRLKNDAIDIEQTDTSFVIPVTDALSGYARWNYSLKDKKNIDIISGLSYNSCCWSLQLLYQRRLQNSTTLDSNYDNSVLIQFVLKGLGNISGSRARTTLERSIYGYHDTLQ